METVVKTFCLIAALSTAKCEENLGDQGQSPAFNPEEMYRDMFPLTQENFTEKVLHNLDPWIIIFHDGTMERAWKTMATHLRGLCWIGMIDTTGSESFLKEIGYDKEKDVASRVYPFGDRRTKEKKWSRADTQNEARSLAVSSLPDKTIKITGSGLQDFLEECFTAVPSKFPVYLITEEDETPVLWKALAIRFGKYFNFARLFKPNSDDLKVIGLEKIFIDPPALFVLVSDSEALENINAVQFDKSKQGYLNYTNVMTFLFAINSEFRYKLPGENKSNQQTEAEMKDIVEIEALRFAVHDQGRNKSSNDPKHKEPEEINRPKVTSETVMNPSTRDEL